MEKTPSRNKVASYKYTLGKTDSMYYGHVIDEAGNVSDCELDVKLKMCPNEKPYCLLTSNNKTYDYVKRGEGTTHQAECYVYKGEESDYDLNKIELKDKTLGTLTSELSDDNENKENKIVIDMTFKAKDDVEGYENVILTPGVVTSQNGLVNDEISVQTPDFYVDTILPVIEYKPNKSPTAEGWYEGPLTVTITCTDKGIGAKDTMTVNGVTRSNPYREVISGPANPKSYTTVCQDKIGNESTKPASYNVKVFSPHETCPVKLYNEGTGEVCKCKTYKSCEHKSCGCKTYNQKTHRDCGCKTPGSCAAAGCLRWDTNYSWSSWNSYTTTWNIGTSSSSCTRDGAVQRKKTNQVSIPWTTYDYESKLYSGKDCPSKTGSCTLVSKTYRHEGAKRNCRGTYKCYYTINTTTYYWKERTCRKSKTCAKYDSSESKCGCLKYKTCRKEQFGCQTYYECEHKSCGCKTWNTCRHESFGVEEYEACWHY